MANEMRDRLVELIKQKCCDNKCEKNCSKCWFDDDYRLLADHLIENGVIVPPVRLGSREKVYIPVDRTDAIYDTEVYGIGIDGDGDFVLNPKIYPKDIICIIGYKVGENLFFTKSEAEQKLKEMRGGNGNL